METYLSNINKLEINILKFVYYTYIKPKHPNIDFKTFQKSIIMPLRLKPKTQEEIIIEEVKEEHDFTKCQFVVFHKHKLHLCKKNSLEDDIYCYIHQNKENKLEKSYNEIREKYEN